MPSSDAFALKNSGLNEFLFAEVGKEVNGSPLTLLSVLARLGQDPWTEAARLTRLPKAALIDSLSNSISQMPLCPQALTEVRSTAARLILLLPSQVLSPLKRETNTVRKSSVPGWVPLAVFAAVLALGIAFEMIPSATPTSATTPVADRMIVSPPIPAQRGGHGLRAFSP
jgi:hypothetical protein